MKNKIIFLLILALLLIPTISTSQVFADDPGGEYFRVDTTTLADGTSVDTIVINGPPEPPPGYERTTVALPEPDKAAGINVLSDVPAFNWSFGCAATSGAMIAGYYDRTGYPTMYTGPTNGGVMPLDNSFWPDWVDSHGDTRHQCPLSATHNGLDGRTTRGHVDDYWIYYGQPGPDPFVTNGWAEHTAGDCTGDFMNTNKWFASYGFNTDGGTIFINNSIGARLDCSVLEAAGPPYAYDGSCGLKNFYESRGYTVVNAYNQYILGYNGNTQGFTFDQYKAEIDAGRPVMILVTGHVMVGLGYDDSSNLMYIHNTWDHSADTMTWGGSYYGMAHMGVMIVQLEPATAITLAAFGVEAEAEAGTATISWETGTEIDNAGFNLYRATSPDGPWVQVNSSLIPAEGGELTGASYTYVDTPGRGAYYYRLEDIDFNAVSALHDPVLVDLGPTVQAPWYRPVLDWLGF